MKSKFFKTFFAGLLFIIPILSLILIFRQLYGLIKPYMEKLMHSLNLDSNLQLILVIISTIVFIIIITYILGLITQSKACTEFAKKLDEELQKSNSVYRVLKLKFDNTVAFKIQNRPPIYVNFSGKERPGFLIEKKLEEKMAIVFIPKDFNDFNGSIFIVPLTDIRDVSQSTNDFVLALNHLGYGLKL